MVTLAIAGKYGKGKRGDKSAVLDRLVEVTG